MAVGVRVSEDFSKYPVSLAERKWDIASGWTPRDMLINLLRQIDRKELDCDAMVIIYRARPDSKMTPVHYLASSPDPITTLGVLNLGSGQIVKDML